MTLEKILTNFLESYMQSCFFAMPAIVIGIKNEEELRVDVQPLVNRVFKDGTEQEYPPLLSVPCIMPHTNTSALTIPVNQGDTVMLLFSQRSIEQFKLGATDPHTPNSTRWMDVNDAVAVVGLSPFAKSPNLKRNHTLPHNPKDVVLTHNLGKANECEVRLTESGRVEINAPQGLFINGLPYAGHTHQYTDDGTPLVTSPPIGQT